MVEIEIKKILRTVKEKECTIYVEKMKSKMLNLVKENKMNKAKSREKRWTSLNQ